MLIASFLACSRDLFWSFIILNRHQNPLWSLGQVSIPELTLLKLMILFSQEDSSDGFSRRDESFYFIKSTGWIAIMGRGKNVIDFTKWKQESLMFLCFVDYCLCESWIQDSLVKIRYCLLIVSDLTCVKV